MHGRQMVLFLFFLQHPGRLHLLGNSSFVNHPESWLTFTVFAQLAVMVIVLHSVLIKWESDIDWAMPDEFPAVQRISYYNTVQTDAFSFLILLAWFKLLEYLSVFRKFSRLVVMFEMVCEVSLSAVRIDSTATAKEWHACSGCHNSTSYPRGSVARW